MNGQPGRGPYHAIRRFDHVDHWVFDLDNTLYPAECDLFARSMCG
ncbi:MAG: hypothetical protein R3C00_12490 [Hyphomonas sp.]